MPIEDINYLYKNSIRQDTVVFIDSKDRDNIKYKRPNDYVHEFAEPFTHVFGFEVIDAAIPRTMFNIDRYNNTWKFSIAADPTNDLNYNTVSVQPADYTIDDVVAGFETQVLTDQNNRSISILGVTTPPSLASKLNFVSNYPFSFDMINSSIKDTLGFGDIPCIEDATDTTYAARGNYEISTITGCNDVFSSIETEIGGQVENLYADTAGTASNVDFLRVNTTDYVAQAFFLSDIQYLEEIAFNVSYVGDPFAKLVSGSNITMSVDIYRNNGSLNQPPIGDSEFFIDSTTINITSSNINSYVRSPNPITTGDFDFIIIEPPNYYWAVISTDVDRTEISASNFTDSVIVNLGDYETNSSIAFIEQFRVMNSPDATVTWSNIDIEEDDTEIVTSMISFTTQVRQYNIITPGIVALVGERFAVLRCPEIEDHLYGSFKVERTPGLALFKLAIVGFSEERYDFVTVKYKEFHPIGRLPRVTIKFENRDGLPYDFKGINHHLLIAIKYFTPRQHLEFGNSILNPNYNPNIIEYEKNIEEREETSSEEELDDKQFRDKYLREEIKYKWNDKHRLKYTKEFEDYLDIDSSEED